MVGIECMVCLIACYSSLMLRFYFTSNLNESNLVAGGNLTVGWELVLVLGRWLPSGGQKERP